MPAAFIAAWLVLGNLLTEQKLAFVCAAVLAMSAQLWLQIANVAANEQLHRANTNALPKVIGFYITILGLQLLVAEPWLSE